MTDSAKTPKPARQIVRAVIYHETDPAAGELINRILEGDVINRIACQAADGLPVRDTDSRLLGWVQTVTLIDCRRASWRGVFIRVARGIRKGEILEALRLKRKHVYYVAVATKHSEWVATYRTQTGKDFTNGLCFIVDDQPGVPRVGDFPNTVMLNDLSHRSHGAVWCRNNTARQVTEDIIARREGSKDKRNTVPRADDQNRHLHKLG